MSGDLPGIRPLEGYVMEPTPSQAHEIADIICGHEFIFLDLNEEDQAYFHTFVLEVLRTHGIG